MSTSVSVVRPDRHRGYLRVERHAFATFLQRPATTNARYEGDRRPARSHRADKPYLFYMGGTGVPSDHLSTITKNTAKGGKLLSCGYASADQYQ
jgi:hypothetical protein